MPTGMYLSPEKVPLTVSSVQGETLPANLFISNIRSVSSVVRRDVAVWKQQGRPILQTVLPHPRATSQW
jgi:hypothetical protein